jgi:hypothetical protein
MTEYNPLFLCPISCKSSQEFGILPMLAASLVLAVEKGLIRYQRSILLNHFLKTF